MIIDDDDDTQIPWVAEALPHHIAKPGTKAQNLDPQRSCYVWASSFG